MHAFIKAFFSLKVDTIIAVKQRINKCDQESSFESHELEVKQKSLFPVFLVKWDLLLILVLFNLMKKELLNKHSLFDTIHLLCLFSFCDLIYCKQNCHNSF